MTEKLLDKKEVEYVADLAKLELTEQQKELFVKQFNQILSYFTKLNELDTTNVEPTYHILFSPTPLHEDIPEKSLEQSTVTEMTKYHHNGYIRVPRIL